MHAGAISEYYAQPEAPFQFTKRAYGALWVVIAKLAGANGRSKVPFQSGVTTMAMASAVVPLISMMNGAAARSNFTLLRIPSQPVASLNAVDFTSRPS